MISADERLLEEFRQWLEETRAAEALADGSAQPVLADAQAAGVGLYRLVEEFTALRHEVKLHTRSARGVEEETQKLLDELRQALQAMRSLQPKEAQAAWSAGKGLALALADLDEALDRGRESLEKVGSRLVEEPADSLPDELDRLYDVQSWLRRRLFRRYHAQVRDLVRHFPTRPQRRTLLEALLDGYALIQQRLSRALAAEGVARILALGQSVDPQQMVVLEVVEADAPPGVVVEEVRRGYTWQGRLLRCAEVRASKARA